MEPHRRHLVPIDPDLEPGDPAQPRRARPTRPTHRPRPGAGVVAAIAAGGMVGASARYGVTRLWPVQPGAMPWATLVTNLAGGFLLGLMLVGLLDALPSLRHLRMFLTTGVLGSFTTMATLQVESALLIDGGRPGTAAAYLALSAGAGIPLTFAGMRLADLLRGRR